MVANVFLPMLDGSPSAITQAMLTVRINWSATEAFAELRRTGDVIWAYRLPGTASYGNLLMRGSQVVAVGDPIAMNIPPMRVPVSVAPKEPAPPSSTSTSKSSTSTSNASTSTSSTSTSTSTSSTGGKA